MAHTVTLLQAQAASAVLSHESCSSPAALPARPLRSCIMAPRLRAVPGRVAAGGSGRKRPAASRSRSARGVREAAPTRSAS
eukprot:10472927-Alexandrium_andersonii.AAC.1